MVHFVCSLRLLDESSAVLLSCVPMMAPSAEFFLHPSLGIYYASWLEIHIFYQSWNIHRYDPFES